MKTELVNGNNKDAISIADDLKNNLEKINHHSKRADAIVKGMLQHSKSSTGQKEPTDINKLADEYLRLAYHGLRAKDGDRVEICVKDNGNGIPQKIADKIFQPFFTTKPTGQGTGLGLSLSYDIVKAHSGELKVKTKEGEQSEFTIYLPIK